MACCSESHALYGTFMAQLSGCIFEWDLADVEQLVEAKKQQLAEGGVFLPEFDNIAKHITKRELATHWKRQTRGSEATAELIQQLITTFSSDLCNDTMGIPLLDKDRAWQVWDNEANKHSVVWTKSNNIVEMMSSTYYKWNNIIYLVSYNLFLFTVFKVE